MKIFIVLFTAIFLFSPVAWGLGQRFDLFKGVNKLVLGRDANGKEIKITIKIMPFPKDYPTQHNSIDHDDAFYGSGGKEPKYAVANLEVWHEKNKIEIPLSAYQDISEIHTIDLYFDDKKSFTIIIGGGDAAASYQDVLIFKDRLIKRIIRMGENPDIVIEETNYVTSALPL